MNRLLLIITLSAFSLLTALALIDHGYLGVIEHQMANYAGRQVFVDLGIALALVWVWLWKDAKALGRNPIPWVVLTLFLGSFGPLIYLLTRRAEALKED